MDKILNIVWIHLYEEYCKDYGIEPKTMIYTDTKTQKPIKFVYGDEYYKMVIKHNHDFGSHEKTMQAMSLKTLDFTRSPPSVP